MAQRPIGTPMGFTSTPITNAPKSAHTHQPGLGPQPLKIAQTPPVPPTAQPTSNIDPSISSVNNVQL